MSNINLNETRAMSKIRLWHTYLGQSWNICTGRLFGKGRQGAIFVVKEKKKKKWIVILFILSKLLWIKEPKLVLVVKKISKKKKKRIKTQLRFKNSWIAHIFSILNHPREKQTSTTHKRCRVTGPSKLHFLLLSRVIN